MPTNGLSGGIVYGTVPEVLGAMRSIFASSVVSDWPLPFGSPSLPPSPSPM